MDWRQCLPGRGEKHRELKTSADENFDEAHQEDRHLQVKKSAAKYESAPREVMPLYHVDSSAADEGGAEASDEIKFFEVADEIAGRRHSERRVEGISDFQRSSLPAGRS